MKAHLTVLGGVLLFAAALLAGAVAQDESSGGERWGARGISLQMTASGASIEFDCGHGSISTPIAPNSAGEFSVAGAYTPETGGPIRKDNPPQELPATYKGTISGDTMHLEVVLSDKSRQPPPFTLTRGGSGKVVKCR